MQYAFDTITNHKVSADNVAKNNIDEPFRYECLCCGEEVHIAAARSKKKSPHFRHLRGNSDKDCEFYLGSLLQIETVVENAVAAAQKRAHSHADILFDIRQQIFFLSISFSKDKIEEYQKGEYELEIRTGSNHSAKPILINRLNFAPDSPVKFPLQLTSNSCYIRIHSRKNAGKTFTSCYDILKPVDFPTFFKMQPSDNDVPIAKRHTDGIIYTDTRYYLIASKKEHIEKLSKHSSEVTVSRNEIIPAFKSTLYGTEITVSTVTTELQEIMQHFGYNLRKAERVTMLWPPAYLYDGEIRCGSGKLFLSSTHELRPKSNISCGYEQLTCKGELYSIESDQPIRIGLANTTLQINPQKMDLPIICFKPKEDYTTVVEVPAGQVFYEIGKEGCNPLLPGCYHLTAGKRIVRCKGNYPAAIYMLPQSQKATAEKRLMDVRKYYNVMIPFCDDLISGVSLSKIAELYIEDCRNTGTINAKALEFIKAGII